MFVAVRPENDPEIRGLKAEYAADESINVFCKSSWSFPATSLDFFINDEQVSVVCVTCLSAFTVRRTILAVYKDGFMSVRLKNLSWFKQKCFSFCFLCLTHHS